MDEVTLQFIMGTSTHLKKTEASHIYKHNGYYYLLTAEGGTGITYGSDISKIEMCDWTLGS